MRQRLRSGTILLAVLGACSSVSDGMTDVPTEVHLSGGVEYRAETAVMESFPVQLHTRVTARNTGAQDV
ncbi:MAG TPA: hypothetical protein VMN78_06230, partial [Longimicrobiales bacterium]|nr:hypothetical protein [Longimicrobiales bacterium]